MLFFKICEFVVLTIYMEQTLMDLGIINKVVNNSVTNFVTNKKGKKLNPIPFPIIDRKRLRVI